MLSAFLDYLIKNSCILVAYLVTYNCQRAEKEDKKMTKTITIHNSMETLVVELITRRGVYDEIFNGEKATMSRHGRTNQEIIDWTIKCYAEPNAVVYVK